MSPAHSSVILDHHAKAQSVGLAANVLSRAKQTAPASLDDAKLQEYLESARPVVNSEVMDLMKKHIALTMRYGTETEKLCYTKQVFLADDIMSDYSEPSNITNEHVHNLIRRLINQRPPVFFTEGDQGVLRNGVEFNKDNHDFSKLHKMATTASDGTEQHFCFENYISYDEMKLSAFLHMSTKTYFMNKGDRNNSGEDKTKTAEYDKTVVPEGIIIGSVGARFERDNLMESQDMLVGGDGVGYAEEVLEDDRAAYRQAQKAMWAEFYGLEGGHYPTKEEAEKSVGGFIKTKDSQGREAYLNIAVYKKLLKIRLSAVLQEANDRASQDTKAYVHLCGLGIGVWAKDSVRQGEIFYDVVTELLQELHLPHVSDVDLSWIGGNEARHPIGTPKEINQKDSTRKINLHNTRNNPSELDDNKQGKLLVQDFAWDSNSFGGNEYWFGMYKASGDPAAACSAPMCAIGTNVLFNDNLRTVEPYIAQAWQPEDELQVAAGAAADAGVDEVKQDIGARLVGLKYRLEKECFFTGNAIVNRDDRSFRIEHDTTAGSGSYYLVGLNQYGNAYVSYFIQQDDDMTEYLLEITAEGRPDLVQKSLKRDAPPRADRFLEVGGSKKSVNPAEVSGILTQYFDQDIFANKAQLIDDKILEIRQSKLSRQYSAGLGQIKKLCQDLFGNLNIAELSIDYKGSRYTAKFGEGGFFVEREMGDGSVYSLILDDQNTVFLAKPPIGGSRHGQPIADIKSHAININEVGAAIRAELIRRKEVAVAKADAIAQPRHSTFSRSVPLSPIASAASPMPGDAKTSSSARGVTGAPGPTGRRGPTEETLPPIRGAGPSVARSTVAGARGSVVPTSSLPAETLQQKAERQKRRKDKEQKIAGFIGEFLRGDFVKIPSLVRSDVGAEERAYSALEAVKVKVGDDSKYVAKFTDNELHKPASGSDYSLAQYMAQSVTMKAVKANHNSSTLNQAKYNEERESAKRSGGTNDRFDKYASFTNRDCKGVDFTTRGAGKEKYSDLEKPNFIKCSFDESCRFPQGVAWIKAGNFSDCQFDTSALNRDQETAFQTKYPSAAIDDDGILVIPKKVIELPKIPSSTPRQPIAQFRLQREAEHGRSPSSP